MTPYLPLEVLETRSQVNGRQFWVRDDEAEHLWNLVEYVCRRLTCWCGDYECAHLRAVVDQLGAEQRSSMPHAAINPSSFVD